MKTKNAIRAIAAAAMLSIALGDGALPTEFRLFIKGWNKTENGDYLFDEAAASAVMSASRAWGVDHMIDLEHQSLVGDIPPEPTARDARGWFALELRDDGSLWAVNVRWTPDGEARLREKRQRYISPAFDIDEQNRVTKIINVAITAIPATHGTPALVAASARPRDARRLSSGPAFSDVSAAIMAALNERFPAADPCCPGGGVWIMDVFDTSVVYDQHGKLFEVSYTFDGSKVTLGASATEVKRAYAPVSAPAAPASTAPAPAPVPAANRRNPAAKLAASGGSSMDAELIETAMAVIAAGDKDKALELLQSIVTAAAAGGAPAAPAPGGESTAVEPTEEEEKQMMAAARVMLSLSGKPTPHEATAEITRLVALAKDLEKREQQLAADRAALDTTERRKLVGQLVTLGVELPATAWADPLKPGEPVERLAKEPIESLRQRVALLSSRAPNLTGGAGFTPPPSGGAGKTFTTPHGSVTLSATEIETCEDAAKQPGCTRTAAQVIETYAHNKAQRLRASGR